MTWIQRFRIREYVRGALWPVPLACVLCAVLLAPVIRRFDRWAGWTLLDFNPSGAMAGLGAFVGAMVTFTGFVPNCPFGVTLGAAWTSMDGNKVEVRIARTDRP